MNATQTIQLWIDNDESLYFRVQEIHENTYCREDFENEVKDFINEVISSPSGLQQDLLNKSLSTVDWEEVLEDYEFSE